MDKLKYIKIKNSCSPKHIKKMIRDKARHKMEYVYLRTDILGQHCTTELSAMSVNELSNMIALCELTLCEY